MGQAPRKYQHALYPAFATTSFRYVGVTLNLIIKGGLDSIGRGLLPA